MSCKNTHATFTLRVAFLTFAWIICTAIAQEDGRSSEDIIDDYILSQAQPKSGPEQYLRYTKGLIFAANKYLIDPDPFPCTDLDPDKRFALSINDGKDAIRMCDLCPKLPLEKIPNVQFNPSSPDSLFKTIQNVIYPECVLTCLETPNCLSTNYDSSQKTCSFYSSTRGEQTSASNVTLITPYQPTGVIRDWVYSRNTRISIDSSANVSRETEAEEIKSKSFVDCLASCDGKTKCNFASYNFDTQDCLHVGNLSKGYQVSYEYGHVAAFKLNVLIPDSDQTWRFRRVSPKLEDGENKEAESVFDERIFGQNETKEYDYLDNAGCKLQPLPGCDSNTGKQKCYYPENLKQAEANLPICPKSRYAIYKALESLSEAKEACFAKCSGTQNCIGITWKIDPLLIDDPECNLVTFQTLSEQLQTLNTNKDFYSLQSPLLRSQEFSIYPNFEIDPSFGQANVKVIGDISNADDCIAKCNENSCKQLSYNKKSKKCTVAKGEALFIENSESILLVRVPKLNSASAGYTHLVGTGFNGQPLETQKSRGNMQDLTEKIEKCLKFCLDYGQSHDRTCDFVNVKINPKSGTEAELDCSFFNQESGNIEKVSGSQTFARVVVSLSITQETLNKVDTFQSSDFYSCFRDPPANSFRYLQDFSDDLDDPEPNSSPQNTTNTQIRRRRGIFDSIGKFFKKVGNAIVDTVKDIGKSIVKGAETIGNVVKGDFKKAKETFLEIPIVRDVKDTVESGIELVKAVGSGDWEKVGNKALDFAGNAVGLIPIPAGKIPGKLAKNILKSPKKATPKPKEKINKPKKDKEAESKKDSKACKPKSNSRGKRATAQNNKKRPCDDDDDDDTKKCSKAIVSNIYEADSSCQKQRKFEANKPCVLVCDAGYEENKRNPVCKKQPSGKFDWFPQPKCEPQDCGKLVNGIATFPVRVNHPQLSSKKIAVYYIKYDSTRKLPVYSATFHDELNYLPNRAKRDTNPFKPHPCTQLVNKQLSNPNYANTGYDRGHVTPDQAISALGVIPRHSTYLFVNIAPQDRHTNQQPWKRMESHVYCFTKKHSGMVITGLCPGGTTSPLPVPPCFWKLVCYKEPKSKETRVVGVFGDNSKVVGSAGKKRRNDDVFTLRSQREIRTMAGLSDSAALAMWTQSYKELVKSRNPGNIPLFSSCAAALDLPKGLKGTWVDEAKQIGKDINKDKNKKTKRSVDGGETFGCTKSELKEYNAFISSTLSGDEDSDGGNSDGGSDNEGGGDAGNTQTFSSSSCGKRLIGYYPSWGKYSFTNVQGKSLTHAVFAFFETFSDGSVRLGSADANNSPDYGKDVDVAKKRLGNFLRIKKTFPHLKTLFAVGGWENSQYFSAIAANPAKRLQFISSTLEIIDQYGFDGVDIDWEHPVTGGAVEGIPADKQNYVQLMKELREALDQHKSKSGRSDKFLISFAGAAGQWTLDPGLDLPGLLKYADFANVMTYDYFGAWASKWGAYTGPPSPLFFGNPKGFSGKVNADWTIKYYVCKSKKPHQINMGVPFYGRYWENVGDPIDPKDGMWRKAESVGGVFKGGFVPWKDVKSQYLNDPAFKKEFHEKAKVPYAFNAGKKIFLGYENPESLGYKVKYAEDYNVGGLMIWALDQDDEDYSMLSTLMKANLCKITDENKILHRCPPIDEKRWWTPEDGYDKAGMCGKSAPLYKGYYPVCDPDDPGYSCCGAHGYCGSGPDFCGCPTCIDYRENPDKIIEEPVKPSMPVSWYILTDEDGKRGRCGRGIPLLNGKAPICNPDDPNSHCCSNGGYCGAGKTFCECDDGCVDFKKNPNYVFKEKTWWDWADGEDKFGRCGPKAPKMNGKDPQCNPDSRSHCCSPSGWCGSGSDFCDCDGCKNYKN